MQRHYKSEHAVKPGLTRFTFKYRYNGVEFSCEEDAVDKAAAKELFKRTHSTEAEVYSVTKTR